MPRYRTEFGVVVSIPAEKAERIGGLTPVDSAPPAPQKPPVKKAPARQPTEATKES